MTATDFKMLCLATVRERFSREKCTRYFDGIACSTWMMEIGEGKMWWSQDGYDGCCTYKTSRFVLRVKFPLGGVAEWVSPPSEQETLLAKLVLS